jgi:hypothetical protein
MYRVGAKLMEINVVFLPYVKLSPVTHTPKKHVTVREVPRTPFLSEGSPSRQTLPEGEGLGGEMPNCSFGTILLPQTIAA